MTTETKEPQYEPGTRHQHQTFLVGEEVYLRTFEPGDEKNATSWRNSVFPVSPERVETWIKEELPKEGKKERGHLAIARKGDDVLVGSLMNRRGATSQDCYGHVDPLYGEAGQRWLAEAYTLYADWQAGENAVPAVVCTVYGEHTIAIEQMLGAGFFESARYRETYQHNGQRFDQVELTKLNPEWLTVLGHPMDTELPRSGNGAIAPIPAAVELDGDPPAQAVAIGPRVYLRPQDKKDAKRDIEMARLEREIEYEIGRELKAEASWAEFISAAASEDYPREVWFTVCLREGDVAIGSVGVMGIDWVNRTGITGSTFYVDYRGQGYGTEAKQLLLEHVFDALGLHAIRSVVYFGNTRSAAALRKQGYKEAGRRCWRYPYAGGFGNDVVFDLLASDWRAIERQG